jgi:hypothetical protein
LEGDSLKSQFFTEIVFIDHLQKSRSKVAVYFYRGANYPLAEIIQLFFPGFLHPSPSFFLCGSPCLHVEKFDVLDANHSRSIPKSTPC